MRGARATTALVALVLGMALPAPMATAQSGAGDNQYSDPCLNGGCNPTPTTGHRTKRTQRSSAQGGGSLTSSPPGGGGSSSSRSSSSGTAAPDSRRTLARTGYDAWLVALIGLGVMVCGVGLRLRTSDARRF